MPYANIKSKRWMRILTWLLIGFLLEPSVPQASELSQNLEVLTESNLPTTENIPADTSLNKDQKKPQSFSEDSIQFLQEGKTLEEAPSYEQERYGFEDAVEQLRPDLASAVILKDITAENLKKLTELSFETGLVVLNGEIVLFTTGREDEIGMPAPAQKLLEKAGLISHIHPATDQEGPSYFDRTHAVSSPASEYVVSKTGAFAYNREGLLHGGSPYSLEEFIGLMHEAVNQAQQNGAQDETRARAELHEFIQQMDLYNQLPVEKREIFRKGLITVGTGGDFATIGEAINAAQNGDTVEVRPGVYSAGGFFLDKSITLRGTGAPGEAVIDGIDILSDFAFIPQFTSVVIENLTFRNFDLNLHHPDHVLDQGGVFYAYWDSNLTLNNVVFEDNAVHGAVGGGAIFAWKAHLTVNNSIFRRHYATKGGAILASGSVVEISDSTFFNNGVGFQAGVVKLEGNTSTLIQDTVFEQNHSDPGFGPGALYATDEANLTIRRVKFINNRGSNNSGAIRCDRCQAVVNYTLFSGNRAFTGGAVTFVDSNATFSHATFSGNSNSVDGVIRIGGTGSFTLTDSISSGNLSPDLTIDPTVVTNVNHSLLQQVFPGAGNITGDPLFSDASQGDYRISYASSAKYPGVPPIAWGSEGFIPDTTPPTGSVQMIGSISGLADYTPSLNVTLNLAGMDTESGVAMIQYSLNGGTSWIQVPDFSLVPVTLPSGVVRPEVILRLTDAEGNQTEFHDRIYTQLVPYLKDVDLSFILTSAINSDSQYPHDTWSNLSEYTQPTHIGFYALVLANLVTGDLVSDFVSPVQARDRLNILMTSLLNDQSSLGHLGLIPFFKFTGSSRDYADGRSGERIMFGDNANLASSLAAAFGALLTSTDPLVPPIRNKIDTFLANQLAGYTLLFDNTPGSSKYQLFRQGYYFRGSYSGQYYKPDSGGGNSGMVLYHDYLGDEFRDGVLFVILRHNFSQNAYLKMSMQFKDYTFPNGERTHVIAPFKGGAFQVLWPLLTMPENINTGMDDMLHDFVTIARDFSSVNNLPGFLSASYEVCPPGDNSPSCYAPGAGIGQIAVNTDNLNQAAASLYTLGAAYMLDPANITALLNNIVVQRPGLVTNHGLWEGYDTAEGQIIQEQVSSNIFSFLLGLAGRGPDQMMAYMLDKGYATALDGFFASFPLDTVQNSWESVSWGSWGCGSNACKLNGDRYYINAANGSDVHTAFKFNPPREIRGNKLTIRYQSTQTINSTPQSQKAWIEFKQLVGGVPTTFFVIPQMKFLQTGTSVNLSDPPPANSVKEITIGFPPNINLSQISEIVLNLNGTSSPLQFVVEEMDFSGSLFGTGGGTGSRDAPPSPTGGVAPTTSDPLEWLAKTNPEDTFLNPELFADGIVAEENPSFPVRSAARGAAIETPLYGALIERDEKGRVTQIEVGLERFNYEYDGNGILSKLIRSSVEFIPQSESEPIVTPQIEYQYRYDDLGRLATIVQYRLTKVENNLARYLNPSASSGFSNRTGGGFPPIYFYHMPNRAVDGIYGDQQLGWVAAYNDPDPSLKMDFGEPKTIDQILYDNRFTGVNLNNIWQEDFMISGSLDGVNWFVLAEENGLGRGSTGLFQFDIPPTAVRFLKVHGFKTKTQDLVSNTNDAFLDRDQNYQPGGGYTLDQLKAYVTEIEVRGSHLEKLPEYKYSVTYDGDRVAQITKSQVLNFQDTNIALGVIPTASANYGLGREPARATDGAYIPEQSQGWMISQGPNDWLQLDFGQEKEIHKIIYDSKVFRNGEPSTFISATFQENFTISGSLDGTQWFPLVERSGLTAGSGQVFHFEIEPAKVRFVRVDNIHSNATGLSGIGEIGVYENHYDLVPAPQVTLVSSRFTNDPELKGLVFSVDGVETTRSFEGPLVEGENPRLFIFENETGASITLPVVIMLDTVAPTGGLTINGGVSYTQTFEVTLNLNVEDQGSGLETMRFQNEDNTWTEWEPFQANRQMLLSAGDGTKRLSAQVRDRAGNIMEMSQEIFLYTTTPTGTYDILANLQNVTVSPSPQNVTIDHGFDANGDYFFHSTQALDYHTEFVFDFNPAVVDGRILRVHYRSDKFGPVYMLLSSTLDTMDRSGLIVRGTLSSVIQKTDTNEGLLEFSMPEDFSSTSNILPKVINRIVFIHFSYQPTPMNLTITSMTLGDPEEPPTGTALIKNGDLYTNSQDVNVSLNVSEGVQEMRYSVDEGSNWTAYESFQASPVIHLPDGDGTKKIIFQVRNQQGMESGIFSDEIVLDTVAPQGEIAVDAGASYTGSSEVTLGLTASDASSGVEAVRYSADNGQTWTDWETFLSERSLTLPGGDETKTVLYEVRDLAGNSARFSSNIVLDTTGPSGSILIDRGNTFSTSRNVTLLLSAEDLLSGTDAMRFSMDGATNWSEWENFSASKPLVLPAGDGEKNVLYQLRDRVGNFSAVFSDSIVVDTVPPQGGLTINQNAQYTNNSSVRITLTSQDATSGVSQMQFSLDGGNTWSDWENYNGTKTLTLSSGDGTKTVLARLLDRAGMVSVVLSDQIVLDTTLPTGWISLAGDSITSRDYTLDRTVRWSISAGDTGSGVQDIRFSADGGTTWTGWKDFFSADASIMLPGGEGLKTVLYQVRDRASNVATFSDTIFLGLTPYLNSLPPNSSSVDKLIDVKHDFDTRLNLLALTLPRRDYLRLSAYAQRVELKIISLRRNFRTDKFYEIISDLIYLFDQIGY